MVSLLPAWDLAKLRARTLFPYSLCNAREKYNYPDELELADLDSCAKRLQVRVIETINFSGGNRSCSQDRFHAGGPNPCLGKDPKSAVCCSLGPEVLFPSGEGDKDVLKTVMSVMRHAMHRYLQITIYF